MIIYTYLFFIFFLYIYSFIYILFVLPKVVQYLQQIFIFQYLIIYLTFNILHFTDASINKLTNRATMQPPPGLATLGRRQNHHQSFLNNLPWKEVSIVVIRHLEIALLLWLWGMTGSRQQNCEFWGRVFSSYL